MDSLPDFLLTEPVATAALDGVTAAWTRHRVAANRFGKPVDVAIAAGFGADRLGYAFLSGYQEALRTLIPELPDDELVAFCATEEGGAHPSAIHTSLREAPTALDATAPETDSTRWCVRGTKSFVTLGVAARVLVVIASAGRAADGRNRLHATVLRAEEPGVRTADLPPNRFTPELTHARVELCDVPVRVLPGDGYLDYLKPFRTIEDIHVLAATLGWLLRVARESRWPTGVVERLLTAVAMVRGLDIDAPRSPGMHIALGAVFAQFHTLLDELDPHWASADPGLRQRWERDRALLAVADRVRAQRLVTAWRSVAAAAES